MEKQSSNAISPMEATEEGSAIDFREWHFANTKLPKEPRGAELGIDTDASEAHPKNESSPSDSSVDGKEMDLSETHMRKQESPMETSSEGIRSVRSDTQLSKALAPREVIEEGS